MESSNSLKYIYPLLWSVVLGENDRTQLMIEPEIPIHLKRLRCNVPEPGMFIVEDSSFMYEHDVYMVNEPPLKDRKNFCIRKENLQHVVIRYTGFIPKRFCGRIQYTLDYSFIGTPTSTNPEYPLLDAVNKACNKLGM